MRGLRCMASTAPSSTFDSTQVSRAVHARKQLLQRCPLQLFRLRGVTFDGRQEVVKQLKPGQPLQFLQEPSNPADPGAVHVTTLDGCSVGYVAQHLTPAFPLQACFGAVVSVGLAQGTDNWGVSAACSPPLHGLALDLLPASWPQADMQQVFGASGWQQLQQQALSRYQQRCAVTSVPASEVPLQVVPQWRFDHLKQQVQLAELIPLCQPLLQLQQLEAAASTNAEQRAAAVSVLQQVMMWEESECVKFCCTCSSGGRVWTSWVAAVATGSGRVACRCNR
ncbi:hypothetical protein COO60DRAFT_1181779 [Scenedesmus sp. NREL 46B-D3]|nr:hypothetical protein COO60DRAFT_1181779 [Scenedesmus sp. NREL 46B-D3]